MDDKYLFNLAPGTSIARTQIHRRFGGITQGGISPSIRAKAVFLFTAPDAGRTFGYEDQWHDGVFHYVGTGQVGDQVLTGLNGSVLNHRAMGRRLFVFNGSRDVVTFEGEFECESYYRRTAKDAHGKDRSVVVFRLRRLT